MAEIRKKRLFRDPNDISENGKKKGDFKQERMFGRVTKIPIANTPDGLVEMDFVDYGDFATFLRIQDAFPRFSIIALMVERKKNKHRKRCEGK